jgi:hypothetical protein
VKRYSAQRGRAIERSVRPAESDRQAAERVQKAWQEGQAKETRKYQAGVAKRAAFVSTIGAWLVRLIGGGGGV